MQSLAVGIPQFTAVVRVDKRVGTAVGAEHVNAVKFSTRVGKALVSGSRVGSVYIENLEIARFAIGCSKLTTGLA